MTHKDDKHSGRTSLRKKAEARLNATSLPHSASEADTIKVIHELQVHQMELLIQNEELLMAKNRAELAEKKYTELFESAPSGYLILSKEGDILELNFSAARLLNKKRSQLINNRFALFINERTQQVFISFFDRVLKSGQKETCEVVLKTKGNPPVFLNIDGVITKDKGFCLLTLVDITKSKQVEESLIQLKVANQAIKFKQSFLANISHEMRTPLTGILGVIDILESTELSGDQKDYIDTLKHSGENLREIINQVLDYSKIEAGKIKLNPSLFESKTLLDETVVVHQRSVKPQVHFTTVSDPKIPAFIFADKSRIKQVINNFTSNALKFTNKGSVVLSSQLISQVSSKQIIIKITVTDTGIGVPDSLQEKLFVPFSQIDDHDSRSFEGTGLGLSISKELVKLLGGEIGFESEYNKGSTFWFTFPAFINNTQPVRVNVRSSSDELNHKHSLAILFAEDKAVNQKVISLILSSMGHKVTAANNGKEVLSLYEPGKFDLILMDIQMPVMDGVTATQKLKEKYQVMPPIVGLSANAFEGDREKYMTLGLDEYLTKPFNKEEFNELITKFWN